MFAFDLIIGMLVISGVSMGVLGVYSRRYTARVPAAVPYVLLMCCAAAWAILYALELLSPSLDLKVIYHDLRFLFLPFFSVIEIWLVLAYVHRIQWLRPDRLALLLVIPIMAAFLAITSPYHTFFQYNFFISTAGPVPVLLYSESLFYTLYYVYSFILLALAVLLLIVETTKKGTLGKMPTLLLLAALALPTAISYLSLAFNFPIPGLNLTPALLWIPAILYTVALFRFQFLDIMPIARSRLIEALSKPVLVLDKDLRVIDMNPAAGSLFSLVSSSALGKSIDSIVPDWPDFLLLCRGGAVQKQELVRTRDGVTHYYLGSAEPVMTPQGDTEGHLIFLQDVTDLKQTEQALRESEKRYRDLFEINNAVMFIVNPETGRIIDANTAASHYYGYSKEEFAGLAITDINIADPKTTSQNMAHAVSDGGRVFSFRHKKKNGEIRDVEVFSAPVVLDGHRLLHSIIQDVTERNRAVESLKESEEKYRTLVESSFDGIAIHQEGIIVYVNQTAARILGSTDPAVLIGRPAIDFAAPAFRAQVAERMRQAPGKVLGLIREQFVRRDGTFIDVDVTTVPSTWKGRPAAYVTFRDITAQARAENALRESEEKYRAIINEMQDIFYRTDLFGKITMLSPSAARLAGYDSNDRLLGRDVTTVYADPTGREKLIEALKKEGSVYAYPLTLVTSAGAIHHVTTSSHFYRDAHGTIQGIEGVIHDITEQWRAKEALRESEEKYRAIIDNLQDVFFRVDQDDRMVMLSPSAAQMFGYASAAEMLGMPVLSLWKTPGLRTDIIGALNRQGGSVQDWESEFVKADGTVFWVSINAHLRMDAKGQYQGTEGTIRDISGRKKLEEALKTALNKLNMLSSITRHDILNQITGLRTFLELSREDLKGTQYEAFIEKEDWAAEAIQRQIEFTRHYQDIGVNEPKWQDAAEVIRAALAPLDLTKIEVKISVAGVEIFADPLIEKVFYNLVENSLRHGEHVTTIEFSSRTKDAGLVITYQDNGVGISAEDKKKLFQRGFGKHTGLGLFLSREILAITKITIEENGTPGTGVRFEVSVPAGAYRVVPPRPEGTKPQ